MKLVADEGVDRPIVEALRKAGYEVVYIAEVARGATDDLVLERAVLEGAILLTADKDFGDLVFRQRRISNGVVLIRIPGVSQELRVALVLEAFRSGSSFEAAFSVIEPGGLRIRRG